MIDLDELERLHAAATPGPWKRADDSQGKSVYGSYRIAITAECGRPNAEFIAALRNAFPALLAELRARRRQVKILDAALCNIRAGFPGPERRIAEAALEEYAALIDALQRVLKDIKENE